MVWTGSVKSLISMVLYFLYAWFCPNAILDYGLEYKIARWWIYRDENKMEKEREKFNKKVNKIFSPINEELFKI